MTRASRWTSGAAVPFERKMQGSRRSIGDLQTCRRPRIRLSLDARRCRADAGLAIGTRRRGGPPNTSHRASDDATALRSRLRRIVADDRRRRDRRPMQFSATASRRPRRDRVRRRRGAHRPWLRDPSRQGDARAGPASRRYDVRRRATTSLRSGLSSDRGSFRSQSGTIRRTAACSAGSMR